MNNKLKDIIEFTISLAFNIHKITLIYTTVFMQYFKAIESEAYNG